MKRFLIRLGVFLLLLALLALISYSFNRQLFQKYVYSPPAGTETYIIGDSRLKTALNPELIPNSINISIPQLPYVLNYHIQKTIVNDRRNSPQDIIINVSPSHLSEKADFLFSEKAMGRPLYFFDIGYPFMAKKDWASYPLNNDLYYKSFIKNKVVPNLTYYNIALDRKKNYPYIGFFRPAGKSLADEDNKEPECKTEEHFYYEGEEVGVSSIDIHYLDSIAAFCSRQNIRLFLLNTPIHPLYSKEIPAKFSMHFDSLMNHLQQYPAVRVLNYQDEPFTNGQFRDCDHLNMHGAEIFSPKIYEDIQSAPPFQD